MKIRTSTIKARRGEVRNRQSSRPTRSTNVSMSTRGSSPKRDTRVGGRAGAALGGNPAKKNSNLLYIGLACFFGVLMMIVIIVVAAGGRGDREPVQQPKTASKAKRGPSTGGQYGAKYAEYDERFVMTEESEMAKQRKKRRNQKR